MTDIEKIKQCFDEIGLGYLCAGDDWLEINKDTDDRIGENSSAFVFDENGKLKHIISCGN